MVQKTSRTVHKTYRMPKQYANLDKQTIVVALDQFFMLKSTYEVKITPGLEHTLYLICQFEDVLKERVESKTGDEFDRMLLGHIHDLHEFMKGYWAKPAGAVAKAKQKRMRERSELIEIMAQSEAKEGSL